MPPASQDPSHYLPLSPPVFHVLVSLGDGERHGYSIIKDVAERTDGRVKLGAGTLYAIIKRLLDDELIVEVTTADADESDKRRRYYRLAPFGRRVARAEVERLEQATSIARSSGLFGRSSGRPS
jgi:DNA-binding PadR family transcriptional regulator